MPASPHEQQREAFEAAMRLFHSRDFAGALPLFETAANGPIRDVMHTARQHISMCRQRIPERRPEMRTTEDYYNYGLGLVAQRRMADAEEMLARALQMAPEGDHILYALCLCRGLSGDLSGAADFLQRAIQHNPKVRSMARTDQDFLEFGRQSPLRELAFGDRSQTARQAGKKPE